MQLLASRRVPDHIFVSKGADYEAMKERPDWSYEGVECFIWPLQ